MAQLLGHSCVRGGELGLTTSCQVKTFGQPDWGRARLVRDLDPFFYDFTRAKSAKELKEHLETRVLRALLLTQVLRKGVQIWGLR